MHCEPEPTSCACKASGSAELLDGPITVSRIHSSTEGHAMGLYFLFLPLTLCIEPEAGDWRFWGPIFLVLGSSITNSQCVEDCGRQELRFWLYSGQCPE